MVEHRNEQRIVLQRNPVYRGRPDLTPGDAISESERLPRIERIQWDYMLEPLPVWYLFLQGRYDISAIPKESFADVVTPQRTISPKYEAMGMRLRTRSDPGLFFYQFNLTNEVVGKNVALRRAVSLALDRETFVRVYRNGRALPGTGIFPPEVPLFDPNYVSKWSRYDPAAAREQVQEAIRIHGGPLPPIVLELPDSDTEMRQYAEFTVQACAEVGITIVPEYNSYARFLEKLDTKTYQFAWTGWYPDYPDEKTYLKLFDARLTKPPGSNTAGYVNPAYQALLEQAETMQRSPERDRLYLQMRDIIDDEVPVVSHYFPLVYSLRYDWVDNLKTANFTAGFMAHYTLDTAKRRKATLGR
jgi:ABC-type transport system substrate-binding protein